MNQMLLAFGAVLVAGGSGVVTWLLRKYALRNAVLDIPNSRSMHLVATPRGGGLAIVLVGTIAALILSGLGVLAWRVTIGVAGGGLAVAGIGWLDDHTPMRNSVRAGIHVVAAVWALCWLGGFPAITWGRHVIALGGFGWLLGVLAIAWATNLYNFMDGIDGLAGGEAGVVCAAMASLLASAGATGLALLTLAIGSAALGFLVFNWSPAKIFMGDVGSGYLGFTLAAIAFASERRGAVPFVLWALVLGVFITDATLTLFERMARGERWYAGHRQHVYQRLVARGFTHVQVTLAILLIDVALACLCAEAATRPSLAPVLVVSGFGILIGLYVVIDRLLPMGSDAVAGGGNS